MTGCRKILLMINGVSCCVLSFSTFFDSMTKLFTVPALLWIGISRIARISIRLISLGIVNRFLLNLGLVPITILGGVICTTPITTFIRINIDLVCTLT